VFLEIRGHLFECARWSSGRILVWLCWSDRLSALTREYFHVSRISTLLYFILVFVIHSISLFVTFFRECDVMSYFRTSGVKWSSHRSTVYLECPSVCLSVEFVSAEFLLGCQWLSNSAFQCFFFFIISKHRPSVSLK
jgi:hypothetical protein